MSTDQDHHQLVFAIDPGLRNLAYCVMDSNGEVVVLAKDDIFEGNEIVSCEVFCKIFAWCDSKKDMFDKCAYVVCEKQFMDAKINLSLSMLVVETVIHCFAKDKFVSVHAMSVKRAYSTNTGDYRGNKRKAVERVLNMCPSLFTPEYIASNPKIDDMCDAYLLAHFFTFHQRQHIKFSRHDVNPNLNPNPNDKDRHEEEEEGGRGGVRCVSGEVAVTDVVLA